MNNYAFIDSQNVNLSIRKLGWILDWKKFRVYLREKYKVQNAYMFLGYMNENEGLYKFLKESGYVLVFKRILRGSGEVKGNVDADLVLKVMLEYENFEKAIVISGDGDFCCLIDLLYKKNKLEGVIVPNIFRCSKLLKSVAPNKIFSLNNLCYRLGYKNERQLHKDQPL